MDYYFNLETKQVEEGPQSPSNELMGPYATREEAARALQIAAQRNESWDDEDAAWKGEQG
ncbi:SPOR domain-containing protein [Brachybacterium huguangmaarense]|uniref:SPOR domain-containing protein n=1 Tax=Brachybacterium huguangmaarense TaxID=1652028 RepID=A0ABY6FZG7_9MICO|nr:SPOR domain-containing protein [Brachybacterium huguangmaarense]UYG16262.1 SPOR domain-containing protein [Brachybacterium huguangmaarense]